MPTHSLLPFVNTPDGLAQAISTSNDSNISGPAHENVLQTEGDGPIACMFCDETFSHEVQFGSHILSAHKTTFSEPTVLQVEAEFRIPGERPQPKPSSLPIKEEEVHSCNLLGHLSEDPSEMQVHKRKRKDYFNYCCNVCGRRFREPWYLKKHMKMHSKSAKSKTQQDQEAPATINDVIQEPPSEPVVTAYKMCMACGVFFPDQDTLVEHSKVHNRESQPGEDDEPSAKQESFLQCLNLQLRSARNDSAPVRSHKWIPQLDPVTTYQAWQLATKGKVATGNNTPKDTGHEGSTDNDESGSDKDELNNIWSEGQGDKAVNEAGKGLRSQQLAVVKSPEPQRRSLIQKDKERPTTCEECQRTFRTYHQLVLHSRVHKRERPGEESPTSSVDEKLSRTSSLEHAEEGSEEGFEENLVSGEDGSKDKSKECNYCGKSYKTTYYLRVHLRTHTGEKPFKCPFCQYAAAQKTSLKYHLDRRHKDKPHVEIPSRPVPLAPSPSDGRNENDDENPAPSMSWVPGANGTPEGRLVGGDGELGKSTVQPNAPSAHSLENDATVMCPVPVTIKRKREETQEENCEALLNLSINVSVSTPPSAENIVPIACSLCAYKTFHPEVMIIHNRLTHKDKSDSHKKNRFGSNVKQTRRTGCPPALNEKDVTPLTERSYPRRTKSPPPQPSRPQEKTPVNPRPVPKPTPVHAPVQDVQETQRCRQNTDSHPSQESSRHTEIMRKTNTGSKYAMDRAGISERSYPTRSGSIWHPDTARLCLSSQFANFPQMDFAEPSSHLLKLPVPTNREAEAGEKAAFRGPPADGSNRLFKGNVKPTKQGPGPLTASEVLGPAKNPSAAIGGGLDSEWSMMNLLRSYPSHDLASLYHSNPANPSHAGLANPGAGSRAMLYPHLPCLSNLQRRDTAGLFPNHRFGAADKSLK